MSNIAGQQDQFTRNLAAALVPSDLPPVNILIVDDEPRNLTVLETILDSPDYRLVRATSPDLALLALVNEEFALLILDVQMPGMTGFELAQTIKLRKKTAQIPIIFLTAHFNDDAHVLEGYGTGAVDYLLKPVNAAALRSKVAVFTELHRRGRDLAIANRALAAEVVERSRAEDQLRLWNKELDQRVAERTAALQRSSARLRLATEAVELGFWLWNLDTDAWSWENDWPQTQLGLPSTESPRSPQELMGLMAADDAARFGAALASTMHGHERLRFEGRIGDTSGAVRAVEIDGRLVEEHGQPRAVLGTIRDVTERHEAERVVRESEARYRALFQSIDEGFCVVDMLFDRDGRPCDWRFRETNEAFHRHSGLVDATGHLASDLISGLEQYWLDGLGDVARTGNPFRLEDRMDGIGLIVSVYAFRIATEQGRSVAMLFRDITERKRWEEALRERERFLSTVTEAARVGIAVIDATHHYRFVNDAFQRMLKVSKPIDIGAAGGSINPGRWAKVRPSIDRALAGESLSIEFTIAPTPGTDDPTGATHVCAFLEPHADVRGSRTVAVVLVDITILKQLEAELRSADRHKDEFLATLAHELRNPLAPVRNAIGILQLSDVADSRAQRAAAIIDRQVKVMSRLIDDLMDVARVSQGRIELKRSDLRLQDVLNLAIEASRPQIVEQGHRLEIVVADDSLAVSGDLTRLAQVFTNILTNAAKYTERGGQIVVKVERRAEQVHISIRDTGLGISADNLERVFEMFSQVEVALARSRGGLGIGLSLAKRLVELHGGEIHATSRGLGYGSEFEVVLPVLESPRAEQPVLVDEGRITANMRVLVVDDNQDGAETLAALLELRGLSVTLAHDGEQALERAELQHPDLVLLDIGLPKLNGYEVCRALRMRPWAAETRIVAVTGWGDPVAKKAALEAGFDRHIVKPISNEQLQEVLDGVSTPSDPGIVESHESDPRIAR